MKQFLLVIPRPMFFLLLTRQIISSNVNEFKRFFLKYFSMIKTFIPTQWRIWEKLMLLDSSFRMIENWKIILIHILDYILKLVFLSSNIFLLSFLFHKIILYTLQLWLQHEISFNTKFQFVIRSFPTKSGDTDDDVFVFQDWVGWIWYYFSFCKKRSLKVIWYKFSGLHFKLIQMILSML